MKRLLTVLFVALCFFGCTNEVTTPDEAAISERAVELADLTETIRTSEANRDQARETCKMLGEDFDAFCRENEVPTTESIEDAIGVITVACKDPNVKAAYVAEMERRGKEPLELSP